MEVNGLLRNIQYNKENNNKIFAGIGLEKRWVLSACPKVLTYIGAELIVAYGAQNTNTGNQWMKTDSIIIAEIGNQSFEAISDFKPTKEVNKTSIGAGFQINAGLQLHLNKRFYLFAQTAPSFLLSTSPRMTWSQASISDLVFITATDKRSPLADLLPLMYA